jgi:hypothetical protein
MPLRLLLSQICHLSGNMHLALSLPLLLDIPWHLQVNQDLQQQLLSLLKTNQWYLVSPQINHM